MLTVETLDASSGILDVADTLDVAAGGRRTSPNVALLDGGGTVNLAAG